VPKGTPYVCYCHTPTHFYWRHYEHYLSQPGFGVFNSLARFGLRVLIGPLRRWDLRASKRPDYFIANSTHIQADIKQYYGRDSTVIHPPVDVSRFSAPAADPEEPRAGFVTVGRQVTYKHIGLIVEACTKLSLPLTVVGRGPERERLKRLAGPTVTFAPPASDEDVVRYMRSAQAFLFAAFEDFGVTEVEALAAGTPVIAYKAGGALDYVVPGKTGEFFTPQTTEALVEVLKTFKPAAYNPTEIATYTQSFATERFVRDMESFLQTVMGVQGSDKYSPASSSRD
jgi:glycosyltransferase involved in cell wall biosynthesis